MKKDTRLKKLNAFVTKFEDDYDEFYWAEFHCMYCIYERWGNWRELCALKDPCG